MMTNSPQEQLHASHCNNGDSNTTQPSKNSSKFRKFFGVSKSEPKVNNKPSSQSLLLPVSQQSNSPQIKDSQDKPSPVAPTVSQLRADTFFLENVSSPTVRTELPRIRQRIERTDQLIYCNALLFLDATSPLPATTGGDEASNDPTNTEQGLKFNKSEQDWLAEIKQDPIEQDHLQWLVTRMVEQFIQDAHKDSIEIAEIVALGPILQRGPYRKLLSSFIKDFDESLLLDVNLLQGLVQLVQSASSGFLEPDDLVKILSMLRIRLEGTHQKTSEHPYRLTLAISRILDVMADHKVQDLDRVVEHEPLSGILSGLQGSSDPFLMYQACYTFQALQFVPDNETPLQSVLRHSMGVVDGLVQISSVFKLDLASVLEGLESLQENLGGAFGAAKTVYEGVSSLLESGRSVIDSLKEGYGSGKRRPWYPAIRAAYAFVQAGQLKDLNRIIVEAPCRHDPLFQWGVCHLLGKIASDTVWDVTVRLRSVDFLGDLYRNDPDWGKDESVKACMLTIINKLGTIPDTAVNTLAQAILRNLKQDQYPPVQYPYPLRVQLPLPVSSPILNIVQNVPYVEYAIHKLRLQRLMEFKQTVYIPPMAKANLQARDDNLFLLMDKVDEFLESNRQVMLILGNSGVGKSTFNQHLEHRLWTDYKRGGSIPLFINLPAIEEPQHDMVVKQLTMYNFTEDQIQELKLHRRVVLICDGYDESQQVVNLHRTNFLNQAGQWNTKMMVSCRSQYFGQDYRSRFVPSSESHYTSTALELFQEAAIAPFSKEQIEQYIKQYIPLEPRVTWRTKDYMDKLAGIPNLMELVKNPFVLTLALEALPLVTEIRQDLSNIKLSRVQLYDTFALHWLDVNKRRLEGMMTTMTKQDCSMLDQLLDAGFVSMGMEFSTNLAAAIFERQGGNPVVRYVHLSDKNTWRAEFFSPNPEIRLLRESSPLSRTGSLFRFLHRSMQEYFFSRTIFAPPNSLDDRGEFAPRLDSLSSDDHAVDTEGPLFRRSFLTEPSILQFLGDRVKQHPWFKQHLLGLIELSKSDVQASQAATNAMTILVRAGVAFNGADLRGVRIAGADLSAGQFDSAQLQSADLTGVHFTKAWIRQVDFRGACMEGARFGELPYLQESESVECCAVSPDSKSFAVGLFGGNINIYDTETWARTRTLQGHGERVTSLAISSNSQQLLSGSVDNTVRLWNCQTGAVVFILEGHSNEVATVVFSPTGMQVASASRDKSVRLWDTHTGAVTFVLTAHTDEVTDVTYSPDGSTIASTSLDGTVRIFDTLTGQSVQELKAGRTYSRLAYSPDGRRIAIGGHLGVMQLWDASTMEQGLGWRAHSGAITGVCFSPDSQWITTSSRDLTVRLWDAHTGSLVSAFSGHQQHVTGAIFSTDGSLVFSASLDKTVRMWEVNPSGARLDDDPSGASSDSRTSAVFTPDGRALISGCQDGPLRQYNADSGEIEVVFPERLRRTFCVAFSPNSTQLATGGHMRDVTLYNLPQPGGIAAKAISLRGHSVGVNAVDFSPCGKWLATGGADKTVRVWDARSETGLTTSLLRGHPGAVQNVAFSRDGKKIASGCAKGEIRLWEMDNPDGEFRSSAVFNSGSGKKCFVAFLPGSSQVASSHGEGDIRLWDDDQLQGFQCILKQDLAIDRFAFSSCGWWLTTVHDRVVRLWRVSLDVQDQTDQDQNKCVSVIEGVSGTVRGIVWRPDKLEFATACWDGSLRVWQLLQEEGQTRHITVQQVWSSGHAVLAASGALLNNTVGLSATNKKLLLQLGATSLSAE